MKMMWRNIETRHASNLQERQSGTGQPKLQESWASRTCSLGAIVVAMALCGCTSTPFIDNDPAVPKGMVGHISGFYGGVAADEPRAVLAGRDVLTAGGLAADAATAMYFMLAVTMPSAAGLGGGGVCLVRDPGSQVVETLDFFGQPSSGEGRKVTVPGNPRGLYALHAKFGSLRWAELIRPAENAARFGIRISRAFAEEILGASNIILKSPYLRSVFSDKHNALLREGAPLKRQDLAAFLAGLRARGAGVLYSGANARMFSEDARRAGIGITYRDLVAAKPVWRSTLRVPFVADTSIHFAMPRSAGGTLGAKVAAILVANNLYKRAKPEEREHLIAEAIQRAIVDGANGFRSVSIEREVMHVKGTNQIKKFTFTQLPESYAEQLITGYQPNRLTDLVTRMPGIAIRGNEIGTTSLAVIDRKGGAVACAFSMNGAFGAGQAIPGTGVVLANPWPAARYRDLSLGAVLIDHNFRNKVYMVGSASGDPSSQAILAQLAVDIAFKPTISLEGRLSTNNRVFRDPTNRITYVERGVGPALVNDLVNRGHRLVEASSLSRVNMAYCKNGLPRDRQPFQHPWVNRQQDEVICSVQGDPRGFGFSSMAD